MGINKNVSGPVFIVVVVTWLVIAIVIAALSIGVSFGAFAGGFIFAWMINCIQYNGKRLLG